MNFLIFLILWFSNVEQRSLFRQLCHWKLRQELEGRGTRRSSAFAKYLFEFRAARASSDAQTSFSTTRSTRRSRKYGAFGSIGVEPEAKWQTMETEEIFVASETMARAFHSRIHRRQRSLLAVLLSSFLLTARVFGEIISATKAGARENLCSFAMLVVTIRNVRVIRGEIHRCACGAVSNRTSSTSIQCSNYETCTGQLAMALFVGAISMRI